MGLFYAQFLQYFRSLWHLGDDNGSDKLLIKLIPLISGFEVGPLAFGM